jgi:hypothetical protein
MKTNRNLGIVAGAAMGLVGTLPAAAGPYDRDVLIDMLRLANRQLEQVQAAIAVLNRDVSEQEARIERLEIQGAVGPYDPALVSRIQFERRHLVFLYAQLEETKAKRRELLDHIDWIMVQLASWDEMEKAGMG